MTSTHISQPPEHHTNAHLQSLTIIHPSLGYDSNNKIIYARRPASGDSSTVAVVASGSASQASTLASFVGTGLLSAALALPQIKDDQSKTIGIALQERVGIKKGVVVVVPHAGNGELHFGEALQNAAALDSQLQVEVLVAPPTYNLTSTTQTVQCQGAGLPLLLKICSAVTSMGYEFNDVVTVGKLVAKNLISVGTAVVHSSEIESDLGLTNTHEDDGAKHDTAKEGSDNTLLVRHILEKMLHPIVKEKSFVHVNSNEVVLYVSGNGSMSAAKIGTLVREVLKQLDEIWYIRPVRIFVESSSSLSTTDFTVSMLNVVNTDVGGPSMIQLLDAPAEALGWSAFVDKDGWKEKDAPTKEPVLQPIKPSGLKCSPQTILNAVREGLTGVVNLMPEREAADCYSPVDTEDANVADATSTSYGLEFWRSARDALPLLSAITQPSDDIVLLLDDMLSTMAPAMNRSAGSFCVIFILAIVQSFQGQSETAEEVNIGTWIYALEHASKVLSRYTSSQTALESLQQTLDMFVRALHGSGDLVKAVKASNESASSSSDTTPHLLCAFLSGMAGMEGASSTASSAESGAKEAEKQPESSHREPRSTIKDEKELASTGTEPAANQQRTISELEAVCSHEVRTSMEISEDPSNVEQEFETVPSPSEPAMQTPTAPADTGIISSITDALAFTAPQDPPKTLSEPSTTEEAGTSAGTSAESHREAIVDALQIKHSDFDAALEGIRAQEPVPQPTRHFEGSTLLDMIREQVKTLGISSTQEDAEQERGWTEVLSTKSPTVEKKDPDEEEYELV